MFSVDNFYDIFRSHYSWPKHPNVMLTFSPHGSKNCFDLVSFFQDNLSKKFIQSPGHFLPLGRILMNDQESVTHDITCTYKEWMLGKEKNLGFWAVAEQCSDIDLIISRVQSGGATVICHSEKNSQDLQIWEDNLFVPCYYWWHGMIARDWFRHWEYHADLKPTSVSKPYRFLMYARGDDGTRTYRKSLIQQLKTLRSHVLHDWDRQLSVTGDWSAKIDVDDAGQAHIQIVPETIFDSKKIHLTEKVFKPMVMCQPFILAAGPGSLGYLRDYGFRTFHDIWDESYDLENNSQHRLAMIIELVEYLAGLPEAEFNRLMEKSLSIVEHNRRHFYSQEFKQQLVTEMQDNMEIALDRQQDLNRLWPGGQWCRFINSLIERKIEVPSYWKSLTRDYFDSPLLSNKQEVLDRYPVLQRFTGSD